MSEGEGGCRPVGSAVAPDTPEDFVKRCHGRRSRRQHRAVPGKDGSEAGNASKCERKRFSIGGIIIFFFF